MKTKSALYGLVVIISLCFLLPDAVAQGKKNGPPPWAPAHGFRAKTRQIYFPEQNFYFDTQKGVYIYLNGNNWDVSVKLPSLFAGIDLRLATKVELNLSTDTPQQYNADHKMKYKKKGRDTKGDVKETGKGNKKNKRD